MGRCWNPTIDGLDAYLDHDTLPRVTPPLHPIPEEPYARVQVV